MIPARSPAQLMPRLYEALWETGAVIDMKALADARLGDTPERIDAAFAREATRDPEAIRAFVGRWFTFPAPPDQLAPCDPMTLADRIEYLWDLLVRPPGFQDGVSQVALQHAYIVPGGAFRECYYWDSYFTLLGLGDERAALREECVAALAEQIDTFGFVPNGTRTYYLSRSQPPTFYASVGALLPDAPERAWARYLPQLIAEHGYWMRGSESLQPGEAADCVVRLPDGALLNRYWSHSATPRDEARAGRDVAIAKAAAPRAPEELYREIRAGCATGWDFSSRWFGDRATMATLRATSIVPIDLNALLFGLERAIAQGSAAAGDEARATDFVRRAEDRRQAIDRWLWNETLGLYDDYDYEAGELRGAVSAAALVPLFAGTATRDRAKATVETMKRGLLVKGGLLATDRHTGEQWDSPNGWAPSHWFAVAGLRRYGFTAEAKDLARRWLETVALVYAETGRLMEKYDVVRQAPGSGGGYPLEDGFGWTNGVTAALFRDYPVLMKFGETVPVPLPA
ncbi:trehalase family glycosidase [Sphingomonas sp.]|uniref:trehalase family glycosidase n=1 Tax=Sphingomonas sp. TaxID=28214 RepID=UPI001B1681C4|nr:trehalase family glycosidase [Sphingomonas sp.]MBO9711638.1 trehalase [Sphingomonas sp.]